MSRQLEIKSWLTSVLQQPYRYEPLAGDASFRCYYRVSLQNQNSDDNSDENSTQTQTFILMDSPHHENPKLFLELAKILAAQGLTVPKIIASNLNLGLLLLSDFGDRLYLNELNENNKAQLYEDAIQALILLHQCQADVNQFDMPFLISQMDLFKDWYLQKHLNIPITQDIQQLLTHTCSLLLKVLEEQPTVFVHRDYHSRNLMVLEQGNPGILDFQDAMRGPLTYDLVSLFQDCYITWPRQFIEFWINEFRKSCIKAALVNKQVSLEQMIRWFDITGLQRHLKNLGIFSRLHYSYGKPHYLKDLVVPLKNIMETTERYPELNSLNLWLKTIIPVNALMKGEDVCAP